MGNKLGIRINNKINRDYSFLNNEDKIKVNRDRNAVPVRCIETGEVFETITDAAKSVSENFHAPKNISAVIKGQRPTAYGFHWEYATDKRYEDGFTKVRCIETGEVFNKMIDAQNSIGALSSSTIWYAVHDGSIAGGYHWEEVA